MAADRQVAGPLFTRVADDESTRRRRSVGGRTGDESAETLKQHDLDEDQRRREGAGSISQKMPKGCHV